MLCDGTAAPGRGGGRPAPWVIAAVARFACLAFGWAADRLVRDYDESDAAAGACWGGSFAHWDGVYFRDIAANLRYRFEHVCAFQPLFPFLARGLATVTAPVVSLAVAPNPPGLGEQECHLLASGVLLSNVCAVLSVFLFYRMSVELKVPSAYEASVALALAPAGVFLSGFYTESLFAALVFAAMLCWAREQWALCCVFAALSSLTRSNGAVTAGFLLWGALSRRSCWLLLLSLCSLAPGVLFQRYAWLQFCREGNEPLPSCSDALGFLTFYSRIQEEYWGVGLLRYYTVKQLPNFLLASPCFVLAASALRAHFAQPGNTRSLLRLCLPDDRVGVFHCHMAFLLVVGLLFAHIQILPRLLVACPPLYWQAGKLLAEGSPYRRHVATYLIAWQLVGCVMFTNFYPWT
ncbi:GPI mannosyltransferase 2 [Diplonema papillatum]|nr:GPI mannosyltransferase 2 [Diplonema papillatum]